MRLIIIPLLLWLFSAVALETIPRFEHIGSEQGLSHATVRSIVQDTQGFIWFATQDGLNRYDGYQVKVFRHDPKDPNSLGHNQVNVLYLDSQGRLWVGTEGGLNRFDSDSERFERFVNQNNDRYSLSHDQVMAITEDHQGRIWVGTLGGLNWFEPSTERFSRFKHRPEFDSSLTSDRILALAVDLSDQLWVGTQDGLNRLRLPADIKAQIPNTFTHYQHQPQRVNSLSDDWVLSLLVTKAGTLWVGTENGLNRYQSNATGTEHFSRFIHQPDDHNSLSDNVIHQIVEDHDGVLWIGIEGGGVNRFDPELYEFTHFGDINHGLNDDIRAIYQSDFGVIWFGSEAGGVSKLDISQLRFNHYTHQPQQPQSLSDPMVWAFLKDQHHRLWIGSNRGVDVYDPNGSKIHHFVHNTNDPHSLGHNSVHVIFEDRQGRVWVGSHHGLTVYQPSSNNFEHISHFSDDFITAIVQDRLGQLWLGTYAAGLIRYDHQTNSVTRYRHAQAEQQSLSDDRIAALALGQQGYLWIGTYHGFNQLDIRTGLFNRYMADSNKTGQLSHNSVMSILAGEHGTLWLGTKGGLNRFDTNTKTFGHYREADGLSNDVVYGVLKGQGQTLWLSTNKGLSRFDMRSKAFTNFTVRDGLQNNEFNHGAYYAGADGELFFGGVNGFNRFYPQQIKTDQQAPKVVFTEFSIANESVAINPESTHRAEFSLTKAINKLDQLVLTHQQSFIAFEFAALHYGHPAQNQYAYKLEGFNDDWIFTDANRRWTAYTNLPAGDYVLRVKASNKDGVWNEQGASLRLSVLPPPWLTWWAYLLYFLLLVGVVAILLYGRNQRQNVKAQVAVNRRLTQLDQLKDDFLANTSHELRTPLNGIIGLAESLLDGARGELSAGAKKDLVMLVSSGKRLANLINDILDFSKLKNRHLELSLMAVDLYSMVDVVLTLDRVLLGDKRIKLINAIPKDLPAVLADENRLAQILHNLVGNGIKFTNSGEVKVSAEQSEQGIIIAVSDTGVGIALDKQAAIFNAFEQIETHAKRGQSGTGLGLSVTRQLVELHGGTIKLESTPDQGSTFSFGLKPTDETPVNHETIPLLSRLNVLATPQSEPIETKATGEQWRVLVVDDEPINRQVLNNHLSAHNYQLIEATSGQQALMTIEQQGPFDLVLLDIMMPKLSGYEVCAKLRQKHTASNLPVIFLTAKNQVSDMVHSFEVGGNDYLTKPINKQELLTRVETHLKFLDIHRNLEDKVSERTCELEEKNREIVETQQQLVQSEKMAALGTLTAGVAHEINNPTNFVYVSSQNLVVDLSSFQQFLFGLLAEEDNEEIVASFERRFKPLFEHLNTINEGTERIKTIVKDLRAFTQLDSAQCQNVKLTELVVATINLVRTQYQDITEFAVDFSAEPYLTCYPAQLNQVLMNLIVNACHAIEDRQRHSPTQGLVMIACAQLESWIEIKVKDNGCGMNDETKTKLFEPFYTTKEVGKGTGLGLSIAYGIVEKHGGELVVESQLGQGSVFILRLPIAQQE